MPRRIARRSASQHASAAGVWSAALACCRLVTAAGGRRETAAGLAGLGDLVLTCTGELSRNRAAGLALARGLHPSTATQGARAADEQGQGPVAEGVASARPVRALAAKLGVEMPIVEAVYRALYEGEAPNAMVEELLNRELKAEF